MKGRGSNLLAKYSDSIDVARSNSLESLRILIQTTDRMTRHGRGVPPKKGDLLYTEVEPRFLKTTKFTKWSLLLHLQSIK